MDPLDPTSVAALVNRGRRAGATSATAFADWLIFDEQWFGPCADMDSATYLRWRRRAEALYTGPQDVYVSAHHPFSRAAIATRDPRVVPRAARVDPEAARWVKAAMVVLTVFLVVALGTARSAMTRDPSEGPTHPAPKACLVGLNGSCAGRSEQTG